MSNRQHSAADRISRLPQPIVDAWVSGWAIIAYGLPFLISIALALPPLVVLFVAIKRSDDRRTCLAQGEKMGFPSEFVADAGCMRNFNGVWVPALDITVRRAPQKPAEYVVRGAP